LSRCLARATVLLVLLVGGPAHARLTQTLPRKTFLLDLAYNYSLVKNAFDDHGRKTQLLDRIQRYEPGGGMQGTIIPDARVTYHVVVPQLQYGITDSLSLGLAVPVVGMTQVEPRLGWEPGDYHWWLGRAYTEEDFWAWAASMGQGKPGTWRGNRGAVSDLVLGLRWRFSDLAPVLGRHGVGLALTLLGALPSGRPRDPEQIVSAGTTSWDLHFQGELGVHLAVDKVLQSTGSRLTLGLDLFYEAFFRHRYTAPEGKIHPLLLNLRPYVGKTYTIDPGDFLGFMVQAEVVAVKGPIRSSWLTRRTPSPEALPPLLSLSVGYSFTYLYQSDWRSDSPLWDFTQEKLWRPGFKNRLIFEAVLSFLRLGAPLQLYVQYKNLSWIPGRNCRASDVVGVGLRGPLKFF
jgi:hypothetical protein